MNSILRAVAVVGGLTIAVGVLVGLVACGNGDGPGSGGGSDVPGAPGGHIGPAAVDLGTAGNYVIFAGSGVTAPASFDALVTGDVGVYPIDSTGLTGFALTVDGTNLFATSAQVIGKVWAPDYIGPPATTPVALNTAANDRLTAYTDAAGRVVPAPVNDLGAGDLSGLTITPGIYKFGTGVLINTDVTLSGGAMDTWIFQVAGGVTVAPGVKVKLIGGAVPKHIVWQSVGVVAIGTTVEFNGVILSATTIDVNTSAKVNGRLLSGTDVTLKATTTVTQP